MSALLLSDEDLPDIAGSIARSDPVNPEGQPLIGWDVFPEAIKGIGRGLFAHPALTLDTMSKPVGPSGELSAAVARRDQARDANTTPWDEDLPVNQIIAQRSKEIEKKTAADYAAYKGLGPDPMTSSLAGGLVNNFTDFGSRIVAGSIVGGPGGAAVTVGATQSAPTIMELEEQGIDPLIAGKGASFDTAYAVASTALPGAFGTKTLTKVGAGIALNVPIGIAQRASMSDTLRQSGYGEAADRYKPFDLTSIGIDAIFGAGFGLLHVPEVRVPPEVIDAAMVAQDAQRRDTQSPFGLPINNEADRQIAAADARAMEQIANGEPVDVADLFESQQSSPIYQEAPPPESGYVRFYHGGSPESVDGKLWFTASLQDAEGWASRGDGMKVWYVDVPQDVLKAQYPDALGDIENGIAPQSRLEFASDIANQRRPLVDRVNKNPEYAPIDPHAAERAELESIFADVRDEMAQVLGDEEPTDWMASRGGKVGFREGSKLRDFIIDRSTGLTSEEIALDYGLETTSVASAISKFRTRVEERLKSGDTLDQIAQEMRITLDVLQKSMTDQKRKAEARDVVLRLARKELSNAQIAERMRAMGFEKTTTESVTVMKSQLRKAGHDIPKGVGKPGKTDFLTSRGEAPIAATPKSDLETALAKSFGRSSEKLMSASKVEVLNSVDELNAATGREFPTDTKAVNGRGKTYVVAENVSPSEARGILLHEVGVHHGLEQMLGPDKFALLKTQIDAMLAAGHPAVMEARALAEAFALKPEHVAEETMAYLVEHHPDMPFVRRMLAQIRQWLWRAFPDLVDLTPDDIAQMAVASLRRVAREDRGGFSDWMTSFGGALATREGRARWAETNLKKTDSGFNQTNGRHVITYAFDVGGKKVDVGFVKMLGANDETYWDVDFDFRRKEGETAYAKEQGGFGGNPTEQFGKVVAAVERFVSEHKADALAFTANNESLARLYSRMAISLRDENTRVWEQTNPENGKVRFILADKSYDPKAEFPRAKPLEKPLSAADMAARTDAAKNDAVARYLDWFRESGGMDNAGNYIDNMRASRKKSDGEMNDPVKAAIAEDPTLRVPNENGDMVPAQDALDKADEGVKQARELAKGFEAAGACAARQARGLVSAGEQRMAELTGGLALGGAVSGAIATAAVPALTNRNEQERQAELDARIQADQLAIAEDRARFVKENPVTSIPVGRDMGNTVMHAADRTGVPEQFLRQLVGKESAGDPNAKASTSSATGATQFLDATWSRELLRVGPKLGFEGDPYSQEALDLRKDPRWAVMVAAEFAKANAMDMKQALGRDPTHGEVYLAHFMGVSKAIDLINAAKDNEPNASALFPKEAKANQNVFHGTARDVLKRQTKNFSDEPFVVNQ